MENKIKDGVPTPMHHQYQLSGIQQSYHVAGQCGGSHRSGQPSITSSDMPHTNQSQAAGPGNQAQAVHQQHQLHQIQAAHTQQAAQLQGQQHRQDALSYINQVRLRFGKPSPVYNEFIDILKKFKSQYIDFFDVISRVSTLFMGQSDLIAGFETFLPPGYKIEVQANDIIVHRPGQPVMSLTTAMANAAAATNAANAASAGQDSSLLSLKPSSQSTGFSRSAISVSTGGSGSGSHNSYHQQPPMCGQDSLASPPLSNPPQAQQESLTMRFVNKVKNRFQGQPDVFKSFLEILNTYQQEQTNMKEGINPPMYGGGKPLTYEEVYSQVTNLLKHQEDLLSEFGQLVPDANDSASSDRDSD